MASLLWLSKTTFNPTFLQAATNASSCVIAPGSSSVLSIQSTRTQLNPMARIAATWPGMPWNGPRNCSRPPTTFIPVNPTLAMRTGVPLGPTIWLPRALRKPAGSRSPVESAGRLDAIGGGANAVLRPSLTNVNATPTAVTAESFNASRREMAFTG